MNLGQILEVKLTSGTQTTWLINSLCHPEDEDKIQTVVLRDIYTIWRGPLKNNGLWKEGYGVSLLLQCGFYDSDKVIKTPITFTSLKREGIDKAIHVDEEPENVILVSIIEEIKKMKTIELGAE
jgi:hypothetical protein